MSKFLTVVLAALVSVFAGTKPAEAQFGLGKYQQKIVNGAVSGGSAGATATGGFIGGVIVGAAAGAGYADTQHNSEKIHNYRTQPVRWQQFQYGHGAFVRQGSSWVEYQNGRLAYYFQEVRRGGNSIDLYDASRQLTVRLETGRALILLPGRPWQFLYTGQNR